MTNKELIKKYGVTILEGWEKTDSKGRLIEMDGHFFIMIDPDLSAQEYEDVVTHELQGHILNEDEIYDFTLERTKRKMETEAERPRIRKLVKDWTSWMDEIPPIFPIDSFMRWSNLDPKWRDLASEEITETLYQR